MKKRFLCFSIAVSVLLSFSVVSLPVFALEYTSGIYTYKLTNGEATITAVDSSVIGDLTIPRSLDGYIVIAIGSNAFASCNTIKTLTVPDTVVSVGVNAFESCVGLTSVAIGAGLAEIPDGCFSNCSSLKTVEIGKNVTKICKSAFANCSALTEIIWGNKLETIEGGYWYDEGAFCRCTALRTLTIPDTVQTIGNYAFRFCTSLTSVTIGDNVTSIGKSAFESCTSLNSVSIPDNVTQIGESAFSGCESLETAELGNGLSEIPAFAFSNNKCMTKLTIGNSVVRISRGAFLDCTSLSDIEWSNSLQIIQGSSWDDEGAFGNCISLRSVCFPELLQEIGAYAFKGCASLGEINFNNNLSTIGEYAFSECTSLLNVMIPDNVSVINEGAFKDCYSLNEIHIGTGLVTVSADTFRNCYNVEKAVIGDNVVEIKSGAFSSCSALKDLTWGRSLQTIGGGYYNEDGAFYCNALETIAIPDSVISIGENAFSCGTHTQTLILGDNVAEIERNAFRGCNITKVVIPESLTVINSNAFNECNELEEIYFPLTLKNIYSNAFANCPHITDVYYSGSETDWGYVDIENGNTQITNASIHYNSDTIKPTGAIDVNGTDITITLSDNVGIAGYYWGTNSTVNKNPYTETNDNSHEISVTEAGTYYFAAKDVNGHISSCYDVTFHYITLVANNDVALTTILAERGKAITPPQPVAPDQDSVFNGWSLSPDAEKGSDVITPTANHTYYAIWTSKCSHAETEIRDAYYPTFRFEGYTGDTYCTDCGIKLSEGESIAKLEYALGDVNADGTVDQFDYLLVKRAYFETYNLSEEESARSDVNRDSNVDQFDYVLLKRAYFGTYVIT